MRLLASFFCSTLYPLLAQAITTVNSSDRTFGGFTTLGANLFWAAMFFCIVIVIIGGVVAGFMAFRQQEIPVMLLGAIGTCICIPAFCFIFGRMVGLGPALDYFTSN